VDTEAIAQEQKALAAVGRSLKLKLLLRCELRHVPH